MYMLKVIKGQLRFVPLENGVHRTVAFRQQHKNGEAAVRMADVSALRT
jgi:hypothetical protein